MTRTKRVRHIKRYGFGLRDLFRTRKGAPPQVRKFLNDHKDHAVIGISVGKRPIDSRAARALNTLTGGYFQKKQRQLGYDAIYHSYIVVTLDNGEKYRIEKNHVVGVENYTDKKDNNLKTVELKESIPINEFMSKGEQFGKEKSGKHDFWVYDPSHSNCQYFVDDLIKGNKNDIDNVQQAEDYYLQPNAAETIAPVKDVARAFTDLAAFGDKLIHGTGVGHKRKRSWRDDHYDMNFC